MASVKRPAYDFPFYVNVEGKSKEDGALKGFESEDSAKADCAERNSKAEALGIKARYVVVTKS